MTETNKAFEFKYTDKYGESTCYSTYYNMTDEEYNAKVDYFLNEREVRGLEVRISEYRVIL